VIEPAETSPNGTTETELKLRLLHELEPYFDVTAEVWLRHPISSIDLRIDLVAVPRPPLDEQFPFPFFGIEVKTDSSDFGKRTHAFKQCLDYKQCVINDKRLTSLRSLNLPCIALYRGRSRRVRLDEDKTESLLVRLVGKFNVGELEHGDFDGLMLLVSAERIWCAQRGVTASMSLWPAARLVANSRRRS